MRKIIIFLFNFLEKIIPKNNVILFNSFPDYSDNSYALFKYMLNHNFHKKYKLIWLTSSINPKLLNKKIKDEFQKDIKCYSKKSFIGIWNYLRAFKVFCTHGVFSFITIKNNKKVNLWHGMPLKAIGFLDEKYKNLERIYNQDYLIATSDFFKDIMQKAFDEENVFVSGQPRNDLLFEKTNLFNKVNLKKEEFEKIFIWMPTYRKSITGDIRVDGTTKENSINFISAKNLKEINSILEAKKYLLIIKLHPMDILNNLKLENYSNIVILRSDDLDKINEQLYPLLGDTDALITDYSSVWIDYEILNKPIFFAMDDYEEYKNTRGLLFENFLKVSPYPIIENYKGFIEFLENYEKIDINNREITDKYNKYKDNNSCERIIKYLGLDKNEK